jgi:lanosterol synthase
LRAAALRRCEGLIGRELDATGSRTLSPVNGVLNAMALHARGAGKAAVAACVAGFEFYRWDDAARGLRYAGGRSSVWDTAFAVEALLARPERAGAYRAPLLRAYRYLADQQMTRPVAARDPLFPDRAAGGWCFGPSAQAWPVGDCTAEALAAVCAVHRAVEVPGRLPDARLAAAAAFVLSRQNGDGGFGSYERARAPRGLERLNPSEMFARCMTDQSYVECTGSCLVALARFRDAVPEYAPAGVRRGWGGTSGEGGSPSRTARAIGRGVRFLLSRQRPDGAFPGAWGVYLTCGTFHAARGLRAAGLGREHPALRRAARWLVAHQKADGGWGEHFTGCLRQEYVEHPESQAAMTSWAVLALCETVGPRHPAVARGAAWLGARQTAAGACPPEAVNGAFFGTAMLDYELYRAYFPAWALAAAVGGDSAGA